VVSVTTPPKGSPRKLAMEFARFLGLPPVRRAANASDIADAVCGVFIDARVDLVLGVRRARRRADPGHRDQGSTGAVVTIRGQAVHGVVGCPVTPGVRQAGLRAGRPSGARRAAPPAPRPRDLDAAAQTGAALPEKADVAAAAPVTWLVSITCGMSFPTSRAAS